MHQMAKAYGAPPSHWYPEFNHLERLLYDTRVFREGCEAEERAERARARKLRSKYRR